MEKRMLTKNEVIAVAVAVSLMLAFAVSVMTAMIRAGDTGNSRSLVQKTTQAANALTTQEKKTARHEIYMQDYAVGIGEAAQEGDLVYTHYVGMLENGTVFDESTESAPFVFALGDGSVIPGWDIGLEGVKTGSIRRIIIPAKYAYGDAEILDKHGHELIPANSTLIFDVAVVGVKKN